MIKRRIVRFLAVLALPVLGGCSLLPPRVPPPTYHDFGLQRRSALSSRVPVILGSVTSPPWLDTGKILYRPAHDSTALHAYATQRWVAPPPDLLAQYFQDHLKVTSASECKIDLRIDRFEQVFKAGGSASALMRVRVNAVDRNDRILASHDFELTTRTTPDVDGAVGGLSVLARHAVIAILDWTRANVAKDTSCRVR